MRKLQNDIGTNPNTAFWAQRVVVFKSAERLSPRPSIKHCHSIVGQNIQFLLEQKDFNFAMGQCPVSNENSTW